MFKDNYYRQEPTKNATFEITFNFPNAVKNMTNCFIKEENSCLIDEPIAQISKNEKEQAKDIAALNVKTAFKDSKTKCFKKKSDPLAKNCPPFTSYIYCCVESDELK